jgi:hypothetical protein
MGPTTSPSLFDDPSFRLASLNQQVKLAIKKAVAESNFSREEILEKVNALAVQSGVSLTKGNGQLSFDVFNKWLNPNEEHYKPSLEGICSIYFALGENISIFEPLFKSLNINIITSNDNYYLELGKITHDLKILRKKQRSIEALK